MEATIFIMWLLRNDHRNLARIIFWMSVALTVVVTASVISFIMLNAQINTIQNCLTFTPDTCTGTSTDQIADQHWADLAFAGMIYGIPLGIAGWLALLLHRMTFKQRD
jgi:hypothetical protein